MFVKSFVIVQSQCSLHFVSSIAIAAVLKSMGEMILSGFTIHLPLKYLHLTTLVNANSIQPAFFYEKRGILRLVL